MKTLQMISRLWAEAVVQDVISTLREAGLQVDKINCGYECKALNTATGEALTVFKAMNGCHGYLVRYHAELFE